MSFFSDLFEGDFAKAWQDIVKMYSGLPPAVKTFLNKLGTVEGKLLEELASVAFQDVVAGGYTTAAFVAAGKDVVAKGLAQEKTILMSEAMAQLNILASSQQSPAQ